MTVFKKWHDLMTCLYEWVLKRANHKHAHATLIFVSFIESSFFPLPPDLFLIPMVLANKQKAWLYAASCTIASVLGGIFGYFIGYFLYDTIGIPLLNFYGYADQFKTFQSYYNEWGSWIVIMGGLTPFPYKVITIASGVTQLDMTTFIVASLIGRAPRFFLVAGLLWKWGQPMSVFIQKNLGWLATLFFVILFGGFLLIKFI